MHEFFYCIVEPVPLLHPPLIIQYRLVLKEKHCKGALQCVAYSIPENVPGIAIVGKLIAFIFQTIQ